MLDERGRLATVYREAPWPGYGSHFLYMRGDLVERYSVEHCLRFVQSVTGERNLSYRTTERGIPESVRERFQSGVHRFGSVTGLDL